MQTLPQTKKIITTGTCHYPSLRAFSKQPFPETKTKIALKLLLVENNPSDVILIHRAIADAPSKLDISVDNIHTLSNALEKLEQFDYDLVLLDLTLPDSQGTTTLTKVKPYLERLPFIILSGIEDEELSVQAFKFGVQDHIPKDELDGKLLFHTMRHSLERHRMQQELKTAQKANQKQQNLENLGMMANRVAHDFNNLLAGISGHATLLQTRLEESNATRYLEGIMSSCSQGSELCEQLLHYSRKGVQKSQVLELNHLIYEVDKALCSIYPETASVNFDLSTEQLLFEGNATQIRQVVMNLLKNAIDALEDKTGSVCVSTKRVHTSIAFQKENYWGTVFPDDVEVLQLEIEDTGHGITANNIAIIFDPFFSTKSNGKGLGLSAVLGIVQAHNGGLKVESTVGQGTRFSLLLPITGKRTNTTSRRQNIPSIQFTKGEILVVDDNETLGDILKENLQPLGMKVHYESNGRDAIQYYQKYHDRISLILLDANMPELDGHATFAKIVAMDPDAKNKIVIMSGYSLSETLALFPEEECIHYLKKPFLLSELEFVMSNLAIAKS